MDVSVLHDAGTGVERAAFGESASHGVVLAKPLLLAEGVQEVDDSAVEVTLYQIKVTREPGPVGRKRGAGPSAIVLQNFECALQILEGLGFCELQALAWFNNCANDEGFGDALSKVLRIPPDKFGPLKRALRAVFPKVRAGAQPVVSVFADEDVFLPGEDAFANQGIATVKAEDVT